MTRLELEIYKCFVDSDNETKIKNVIIPLFEKRGGGWHRGAQYLRASYRLYFEPNNQYDFVGFRLLNEKDYMIKLLNLLEKYSKNYVFNVAFDKAIEMIQ